jgi:hypothetical protein
LPKPAGTGRVLCYAPAVAPDNTALYFHAEDDSRIAIATIPLPPAYADNLVAMETLEAELFADDATFYYDMAIGRDGTVAVQAWSAPHMAWNSSAIHVMGMGKGGQRSTAVTPAGLHACQPRYSPDGMWLAFLSDQSGWLNLWVAPASSPSLADAVHLVHEDIEVRAWPRAIHSRDLAPMCVVSADVIA